VIRTALAVIAGLIVWMVAATALDVLLRLALPGYAAAEPNMQFTLGMMLARLALPGGLPSIAAGFACAWIAPGSRAALPALTVILLGVFLPTHYQLWARFPVWYHLTFLSSLVLLTWIGARLYGLAGKDVEPAGAPAPR
jgi:hypothetical protein